MKIVGPSITTLSIPLETRLLEQGYICLFSFVTGLPSIVVATVGAAPPSTRDAVQPNNVIQV